MAVKLLFFDIDGTIWDWQNMIPDSTKEAIHRTRSRGNLAFLNSGRTRGFIRNEELLGIGFDGIVSGGGTMIEYRGDVLYDARMPVSLVTDVVEGVRSFGWRPILEGPEYLYMDDEEFVDDYYGDKLRREMGDRLKSIKDEWGRWDIQKLSCKMTEDRAEECIARYEDRFDFILHNKEVCEMVPRPHTKGTGITFLAKRLGVDIKDTYAFGDSVNDRGMLLDAGCAVVMGNGTDKAKEMADFVTSDLQDDGIWKACVHFGLV